MVETTKAARMIEATQFTKEEFEKHAAVGGPPLTSEFKKGAFEKLAGIVKDSKSELNVSLGGMKNVRRVRVLRDANITDGTAADPGKLVLVFDLMSAALGPRAMAPRAPVKRVFQITLDESLSSALVIAGLNQVLAEYQLGALVEVIPAKESKGPFQKDKRPSNGKKPAQKPRPAIVVQTKPQTPPQN